MTIKFDVLNRFTGKPMFTAEIDCAEGEAKSIKIGLSVKWALENGANLGDADLWGANLRDANLGGANLRDANLGGANLRDADLRGANLRDANLWGADLWGADLGGANLRGANLGGADLGGANLWGADLGGANLRDANLRDADLGGANLGGADLGGANLRGANLRGAKEIPPLAAAQTRIAPDGQIIGWKKCSRGVIVKLSIPDEARRSNATGRKCRAEFADVIEVFGAEVGVSQHDCKTKYRSGERVTCDTWCEDRWQECAGGIHFWLTREEAEDY